MKIIDIRQNDSHNKKISYEPLRDYEDGFICRKYVEENNSFYIDGFFKYNIDKNTFKRIDNTNSKIDYTTLWFYYLDNIYFTTSRIIDSQIQITFHELNIKTEVQREVMNIELKTDQGFSVLEIYDGHIIYYIEEDDMESEDYDLYSDIDGEYCHVYVYDFINKKRYEIYDKSIILSVGFFEIFNRGQDEYFMIEEKYMEEWEKEDAFNDGATPESFTRGYIDRIRLIKCSDFINSAKSKNKFVDCINIDFEGLSSSISYITMDDNNIYYKKKNFKTGRSELICLDILTLEKKSYSLPKAYNYLKIVKDYIFIIYIKNNLLIAQNLLNKDFIISCPYPGDNSNFDEAFYEFIDNKYIIIEGVEDNGTNIKNYSKIFDMTTGELIENKGKITNINKNIILY